MATVQVRAAATSEALAFLDRLEATDGVPAVDEDEQRRLTGHTPVRDRDWWWGGHLAVVDDVPVAYAGTRLAPAEQVGSEQDCAARVDLAFDRRHPAAQQALRAALDDARDHAVRAGTTALCDERPVEAWLRGATAEDLATAAEAGFSLKGRLHVMGATVAEIAAATGGGSSTPIASDARPDASSGVLPDALPGVLPEGLRLRTFDADARGDADAVVALLSAAYPHMQGWYGSGFAVLCATGWFRSEDLLMLESADGLLGIHWMKRRGDGVGEVYNLALTPAAQGQGLGGLLLDAGLAHLMAVGTHDIILWVDADNAPALALYRSRGFAPRWDDVSLAG